jgi:hypothetical protein
LLEAQQRVDVTREAPTLEKSDLSDIIKKWDDESTVRINEISESIDEYPAQDIKQSVQRKNAPPLARVEPVEDDGLLIMDPLVVYQQLIADALQRHIKNRPRLQRKVCVLGMDISRDGLVINSFYVSGDPSLCSEGERAAIRAGKLPVPEDDDIYKHLNQLQITLVGA